MCVMQNPHQYHHTRNGTAVSIWKQKQQQQQKINHNNTINLDLKYKIPLENMHSVLLHLTWLSACMHAQSQTDFDLDHNDLDLDLLPDLS